MQMGRYGSEYLRKFKTIFQPSNEDTQLLMNTNSDNSLFMILDARLTDLLYPTSNGKFLIGINQAVDASSILENHVEVIPGLHTTIEVSARKIEAASDFKSLSKDTRSCSFSHEQSEDSKLFK